jgi:hypothetical protein
MNVDETLAYLQKGKGDPRFDRLLDQYWSIIRTEWSGGYESDADYLSDIRWFCEKVEALKKECGD